MRGAWSVSGQGGDGARLNANLVRKWRRTVGARAEPAAATFVPVTVSQACAAKTGHYATGPARTAYPWQSERGAAAVQGKRQ